MEQKDKRFLCVGLICLDIISVSEKYPEEDSDQRSLDYFWRRGGNASNSSTVLSVLGAQAEVLGTMTKDQKAELDHYEEVSFDDFGKVDLNSYKWIHFEGRRNGEEMGKMIDKVTTHNSSVGDSQRITISLELEKRNRPQLTHLIGKTDYIFMSKEVAREKGYDTKEKAVASVINSCQEKGTVICAWGEDGAAGLTKGESVVSSKAFPPYSLVDTVGAGDTFNAATILALSEGKTLHEAIVFGCKVAGAKCGMMGYKDLQGFQSLL